MKENLELAEMEVGPKISREQYFEWRCFIYDIDMAKQKAISKEHEINLHSKDIEISSLKRALLVKDLSTCNESVEKAKVEYQKHRDNLGQLIGCNLDGAIIDPITLEVKFFDQKESK